MTSTAHPNPPAPNPVVGADLSVAYRRFAVQAAGLLAVCVLLGFFPTRRLVGDAGLVAMFVALGADLVASIAGTVPLALARTKTALEAMPAQFGAMLLRLGVVAALAASAILGFGLEVVPFLVWLAIGHAALLYADTVFARDMVRSMPIHKTQAGPTARATTARA